MVIRFPVNTDLQCILTKNSYKQQEDITTFQLAQHCLVTSFCTTGYGVTNSSPNLATKDGLASTLLSKKLSPKI